MSPRDEPAVVVTKRQISRMTVEDLRVSGIATAYRLFDVGYEIDLERVVQFGENPLDLLLHIV